MLACMYKMLPILPKSEKNSTNPTNHKLYCLIIMDAGLEYLHKSCQPPLIHRDVKTKNILLSADLEAKIADFGLMKAFADESKTHVTTMPAGTLGYLDPEYYNTTHPNSARRVMYTALELFFWNLSRASHQQSP